MGLLKIKTGEKMRPGFQVFFTATLLSVQILHGSDRVALVIGNANYRYQTRLNNSANDATDLAAILMDLGFEVQAYTDLSQKDMQRAIDEFGMRIKSSQVGLFFFAGHGMQAGGENYLFPVDANPKSENEIEYDCVNAGRVLGKMQTAGCKFNIVILDACRDNPFSNSWTRGTGRRGLAFITAPSGSIIAYATSPGQTAEDGSGRNGLYTSALLKHLKQPGLRIEDVFKRVRIEVQSESGGDQVPWELSSLTGDFYFRQSPHSATISSDNMIFVKSGSFNLGDIFDEGDADEKPVHKVTLNAFYLSKNEVTFQEYDMFCDSTGRDKLNDAGWGRGERPVINVSWPEAIDFCNWKSWKEGLTLCYRWNDDEVVWNRNANGYRLPTEAEWECAAREGGKRVRFGNGKDIADPAEINFDGRLNYKEPYSVSGDYRIKTTTVRSFKPNQLGLYDMSGNVWEWCWDWYDADYYAISPASNPSGPISGEVRVIRGGGWGSNPQGIRATDRDGYPPSVWYEDFVFGFRLARNYSQ